MLVNLTAEQCRVIGVMLEKEITTPDQYPLSLNGLTSGCNQKSNREPVMNLNESEVQNILDQLKGKKQIAEISGFGSRVVKYQHRFCNTEFGDLQLSAQQLAIICVLLLRGPQTPGELRTRTNRLAEFNDVSEVESCLSTLMHLNGETLVLKLAREPGKRESRYMQLFDQTAKTENSEGLHTCNGNEQQLNDDELSRVEALELQVKELAEKLEKIQSTLDDLIA